MNEEDRAQITTTQKRSPSDFLKQAFGRPVLVKLHNGTEYRGVLACLDGVMNVALEQTEEWENGQLTARYGDCFIRGNNEEHDIEGQADFLQEGEVLSVIHDRVLQQVSLPKIEILVDRRYQITKHIGTGSYGTVCGAVNKNTNAHLAVKCVKNTFGCLGDAKRIIREVRLLRTISHPNIIGLVDLIPPATRDFDDITMVFPLMDSDLKQLSHSGYHFTDKDLRYIIYRVLAALHYLHARGIAHRDIKSANILLSSPGVVKLCDFGLARTVIDVVPPGAPKPPVNRPLTAHITTRWYRAPEVMLTDGEYDYAVDIWATGCVLGEMLAGKSGLFPGKNAYDQMKKIVKLTGTPTEDDLSYVTNPHALRYMSELAVYPPAHLKRIFPSARDDVLSLLKELLCFDYRKRLTARAAILHPAFADGRDPALEIPPIPMSADTMDEAELQYQVNSHDEDLMIPDMSDIEETEPSRGAYQDLLMAEILELDHMNRTLDSGFLFIPEDGYGATTQRASSSSARSRNNYLEIPAANCQQFDNPQNGGSYESEDDGKAAQVMLDAPAIQVRSTIKDLRSMSRER